MPPKRWSCSRTPRGAASPEYVAVTVSSEPSGAFDAVHDAVSAVSGAVHRSVFPMVKATEPNGEVNN